jgi:hypothetical protein
MPINIDEIDRKFHEEGMDRLAGDDPETLARRQASATEQALVSGFWAVSHVGAAGEFRLAGEIGNSQERSLHFRWPFGYWIFRFRFDVQVIRPIATGN